VARFWFRVALCAPLASGPLIPAPALQVTRGIAGATFTCPAPPVSARCLGWHCRWCISTTVAPSVLSVLSHGRILRYLRRQARMLVPTARPCCSHLRHVPSRILPLPTPASQVAGSVAPATPRLAKVLARSVTPRDSCTNLGKELLRTELSSLRCRHAVIVEPWKQTLLLCC
jgi:hypothetical protein